MASNSNPSRIVGGRPNKDGTWRHKTALTTESHTGPVDVPADPRRIIPVIFIPGIMGTKLRKKGTKKPAWNPPNTLGDALATFWEYLWKGTSKRIKELDPEKTEVDYVMPKNIDMVKDEPQNAAAREHKRWGALWADGYHSLMQQIEIDLNQPPSGGQVPAKFKFSPQDYGARSGSELQDSEFKEMVNNYRFEVWGGGYNWLQSNGKSAEEVWQFVEEVVKEYPENIINKSKKVLIVSHSMGGLVTRAICAKHAAKIIGVVHIAHPASGAPVTYKRMRAGFEFPEHVVLGRNAADVTGILSRARGGLELLPFANYKATPWLFYPSEIAARSPAQAGLPAGEPYDSIYKNGDWYGLIPDYNLELMLADQERTPGALVLCKKNFSITINEVKNFHDRISNVYHPQTYAIWGEDPKMESWRTVRWKHKYYPSEDHKDDDQMWQRPRSPVLRDNRRGYIGKTPGSVHLQGPEAPGDGTVPDASAQHQESRAKICFIHGNKSGKKNEKRCWEHTAACNEERVKWATAYSIVKLVNDMKP